ncbi:MAG: hypothetical protein E7663_06830 [Ruminococcaceae bacterium]|nr:hypothetical protein [Oscillospiraceae bacterium]
MIPQAFLDRMRTYLSEEEYARFCLALDRPAVRALRLNPIKTDAARALPLLPFASDPVPFAEHAYYATSDKVGAHPAHHAGMIYMQDPSAISAVAAASPQKGLRVLDLCAAPGGKSTQLAAAIGDGGVLVANEYVPARCRILQGNIERMGVGNAVITNLSTKALADFYGSYFDLVVADAPCSGEGMLRKYEVAGEEWSAENVALCAERQREILDNAALCVAPGGRLLYSTCTFSIEENEQNVAHFLDTHPDFSLIPVSPEVVAVTADGMVPPSHPHRTELTLTRRFYPHLAKGEGQFVALLQRRPGCPVSSPKKDAAISLSRGETDTVTAFFADTVNKTPRGRLCLLRDTVCLAPDIPLPPSGVFVAGVALGTVSKGRLEPHHHFYSALGKDFIRRLDLSADDPRVRAYLFGEEIDAPELAPFKNGYAVLLFEGAPLGGGKAVSGRLKNHYPKGLRNKVR